MKLSLIIVSLFFAATAFASHGGKELLMDIKVETTKCSRELVSISNDGSRVIGYKSICNTLKILSQSQAQIFIDGAWLTAVIVESPYADEGDLDDLTIYSSTGRVLATLKSIPAFDNVIAAMLGNYIK